MKNEDSIMHPSESTKAIITTGNVFDNSGCLFIEYMDTVRAPWYTLSCVLDIHVLGNLLDVSPVIGYKKNAWKYWYVNRKTQDPFLNFTRKEGVKETDIIELSHTLLHTNDAIIQASKPLAFYNAIETLEMANVAQRILMWTDKEYASIRNDIAESFPHVEYVFGDLKEVLSSVNKDATYVFSNGKHIACLQEMNRLEYATVLLADTYTYSMANTVDIEALKASTLFRYSLFDPTFL